MELSSQQLGTETTETLHHVVTHHLMAQIRYGNDDTSEMKFIHH